MKNIILGAHFLGEKLFKPLYFLKWCPIFDIFCSTECKTQKLFKWLVVGFGHKKCLIIKSLGKAEVFFISVASPVFSENPPKFHQKSQIYRTPLTGGLAKRSAKIKITPIPNSSLTPCFDMSFNNYVDRILPTFNLK